jgi:hypothetical protein
VIEVLIDEPDMKRLLQDTELTERKVNTVLRMAARRASKWAATRARRSLRDSSGLPNKAIKERLGRSRTKEPGVWIGLNPVSVGKLNPRANRGGGVRAGGRTYPRAFVTGRRGGPVVLRRQNGRVEKVGVPIHRRGQQALAELHGDAADYFEREFARLLKVKLGA